MEIIKYTDKRYLNLDKIFKYNWSSICDHRGYRNMYYLVPKELNLIDNLDRNISSRYLGKYLRKYCDLSIQEYFDLIILHINNTDDRPKCSHEGCNNQLKFVNMSQGYRSMGSWHATPFGFCCNEHQRLDHEDRNKESLNSVSATIKRQCSDFISRGNPTDKCILYFTALIDGRYKYGITGLSLELRKANANRAKKGYSDMYEIATSDRITIANIEKSIKLRLNGNEYISKEDLPKFRIILADLGLTIPSILNDLTSTTIA